MSEGFVIRREKLNKLKVRTLSWPRPVARFLRLVFGNHIFALAEPEGDWYRYPLTAASDIRDEPYDRLKRALRNGIEEPTRSALYPTKSHLFPKPETGKIAVNVINHYRDGVLKVYQV